MINTIKNYIRRQLLPTTIENKGVVEAYDIWAENYDAQPGNLMLDLDEILFTKLLGGLSLENKTVVDIGCGTGRHWGKIFQQNPASLTGFDVSTGMLEKLTTKFPEAKTYVIMDNHFEDIADDTYDVILSTLTVAHIKDIESALKTWCRITKQQGDMIITDFHPNALASGGRRTFRHGDKHIAVQNFVHTTDSIKHILLKEGFTAIAHQEIKVDETVKHYYEQQNALHVYEKFKDQPIIYGIHFKRV
ncbi:class I SAM-dependent methyltransferase [Mucilaginibacter sp. E4BP6]|uniref:class I SAM-dependent methyltransferase n=1 Tax=Mucilaginibacter sp. E4BP6 TaxID=2723089 RepID=UPI0015CDBA48|nr:class I SAM-dependent methyltransferase [Mucilaginibacter sp. E4BP6]NYE65925.1 ubiquinone/menaquinone biosynthesis C-methylase UbiE [Mucilaginibacter sp. E4BP6]